MRRWLSPALWLLAWAVWALLGIGLSRELPRNFGPVLCKLRFQEREQYCGFLGNQAVVSRNGETSAEASHYRIWDVATGDLIHDWKGPARGAFSWELLRLGGVVGVNLDAESATASLLHFLDLRTGTWTSLGSSFFRRPLQHASRPWLAVEDTRGGKFGVRVFDVEAKRWIFDSRRDKPIHVSDEELGEFWFDGDDLTIIVQVAKRDNEGRPISWDLKSQRLERWRVPTKALLEERTPEPPRLIIEPPGPSGRMLVAGRDSQLRSIAVVDSRTLATVYSSDDPDGGGGARWDDIPNRPLSHRLSRSGRRLLTSLGRLIDLDTGKLLWRRTGGGFEIVVDDTSNEAVAVLEQWDYQPGMLRAPWPIHMIANRDMESGRLRYRVNDFPGFESLSPDGRVIATSDGTLYEMPYRVNWLLLAFCQVVLALPIMFVWLLLRWRRKRIQWLAEALA